MSSPLDEIAARRAGINKGNRAADRAFVIYAPKDIDYLLSEVQRLHARVQELEREQSEPHGWSHTSNAPYPRD